MKIKTGFLNRRWLLLILLLFIVAGTSVTAWSLSLSPEKPTNDRQLLYMGNIISTLKRIALAVGVLFTEPVHYCAVRAA